MNNMKTKVLLIGFYLVVLPVLLKAQTVVTSKHNLSVSGMGTVTATTESEICIFCHTPHASSPLAPLWNKNDPGNTYTLYSSSTLQAIIGQPDGSAILCLSCHDGTIALGALVSRTTDVDFVGGITTMPVGAKNLSTDLSDDHPVSFTYTAAMASGDGQLKDPSAIGMPVQLENGKVQCVSCHDPHNDTYGKFLVATKQYSDLCFKCHDRNFWASASHNLSNATWNGSSTNPWQHIEVPYPTVAENACENCHDPHNSAGKPRLLKASAEEYNCLDCHNGNVAATDIETETLKIYTHNLYGYNNIHDPTESAMSNTLHVECQDCHNPHAANSAPATAPMANGFLTGVKGIDQSGNAVTTVTYEYELCFRCHADSPAKPASAITRQIEQNNVRLEFDLGNPSFHPVEGVGVNNNVPSLIAPLTTSSIIYCTDCHASDGASPAGPHGSIYPQILKYRYETADFTPESATNYELCYSCHSQTSILNDDSFGEHNLHISGEDSPCSACHDSHGISSSQGNSTNNSHLINFDLSIVSPEQMGRLRFEDTGTFKGRCYLTCHGQRHRPKSY
jgi:predicted CXXCH cytochrome family protein